MKTLKLWKKYIMPEFSDEEDLTNIQVRELLSFSLAICSNPNATLSSHVDLKIEDLLRARALGMVIFACLRRDRNLYDKWAIVLKYFSSIRVMENAWNDAGLPDHPLLDNQLKFTPKREWMYD